ncbi:MAG: NUDIX hydrolase [Thermodesulfobacteriota bacterium]|nr:NUDIX hydrolase [Thermodesulfobacteriota bacterium]
MAVRVNKKELLYAGRVFKLMRENITLENGVTTNLDIVRHPGASAMVPIYDTNTVLLIKQYRHAVGSFIWEFPAGTLNDSEAPLECAKRELVEETGFNAETWEKLGEITPVPGYSDERIHVFLASDLRPARQNLDSDEVLSVHKIKLNDVVDMVNKGEIQDSKTISSLFMAINWLKKG